MNEFILKRESLESYVKEQIVGPGAYNIKFVCLEEWNNSIHNGKNLLKVQAIHDYAELIPEVPAYQYSSAILFPVSVLQDTNAAITPDVEELSPTNDDELAQLNMSADDENLSDDTSTNVVLTQQNYPNIFGLSFVFDRSKQGPKDLNVSLSYRKYRKLSKRTLLEQKISIHIKEHQSEILLAVDQYLGSAFGAEEIDGNFFLYPKRIFSQEDIYSIDYNLINQYVRQQFIPVLSEAFHNKLVCVNNENHIQYFGLEDNGAQFYSISENKHNHSDVYTVFTDSITTHIQKELEIEISKYELYKELIKQLEILNQLLEITTDLKTILKEKNASPLWQSTRFSCNIELPPLDGKRVQRESGLQLDSEVEHGLRYHVQYINNADDQKVYVKLLIENTNQYQLGEDEPPQLNKKDGANELAIFGVELVVTEKAPKTLLQYNPPQLLDFDEEESFNKLLYRNYIDYGEGHNTSVNWGETTGGLTYISSDFLPSQTTPSVDFKPSKIQEDKVVDRISDDKVLSMRFLSTLSESDDESIIKGLNRFIDNYGMENSSSWISEKRELLRKNQDLDSKAKALLERQLLACQYDYQRLKRNIRLLEENADALSAFRIMNTAMFMQLHHSIEVKKPEAYIVDQENAEEFYSTLVIYDDKGLETEYKWRSFQLAFILLNIDGFVKPNPDGIVEDVFKTGWPERNEIADLVWFPTGGGKTEAYLGIIAFAISYRRFTKGVKGYGTTVLMRYTLRMLTLQQFQRATMLICALEVIRKDNFSIPNHFSLGHDRITIGLFIGGDNLPNYWNQGEKSMLEELSGISKFVAQGEKIKTKLPFTQCPWCGGNLFVSEDLRNVSPNHTPTNNSYGISDLLNIACNTEGCTFHARYADEDDSLPLRLFDEDIYKSPPTLLFGTVDKFAAFANNISTVAGQRNKDSRRLVGQGYKQDVLPPELIIQDELHLLLGPLGSSVALFEKSIDYLCTYTDEDGQIIKPKIVTSTATTRNTDKQIFALFNRRAEIFPKQGISCDDSFFAFYKRDINQNGIQQFQSKRKYVGVLPVGKTQVWMQLRIISICLAHRLKYFKANFTIDEVFESPSVLNRLQKVFDYYHTVLAYFNSLKDVGKAQSQLDHYLPGDINYVIKNTIPWSFIDRLMRKEKEIIYSELTGRLTGEQVKTYLSDIEQPWTFISKQGTPRLNGLTSPEFVISTNMISVGIDVSRFNTMVISSMPRNIAEYIQASSRVARDEDGIVFTIHHPFRSRDISHYQKFKEFHEKFYSYVEPISVTPFATKALDRYLAMYAAVIIRHNKNLGLMNNDEATLITNEKIEAIKDLIKAEIQGIHDNSIKLEHYLHTRKEGVQSSIDGIISQDEVDDLNDKISELLDKWIALIEGSSGNSDIRFRVYEEPLSSLFISIMNNNYPNRWKVSYSLREIAATSVIKTVQQ